MQLAVFIICGFSYNIIFIMNIAIKNSESPAKIAAANKKLKKKVKQQTMADFYAKLKGVFDDGLSYQKQVRNEWS